MVPSGPTIRIPVTSGTSPISSRMACTSALFPSVMARATARSARARISSASRLAGLNRWLAWPRTVMIV